MYRKNSLRSVLDSSVMYLSKNLNGSDCLVKPWSATITSLSCCIDVHTSSSPSTPQTRYSISEGPAPPPAVNELVVFCWKMLKVWIGNKRLKPFLKLYNWACTEKLKVESNIRSMNCWTLVRFTSISAPPLISSISFPLGSSKVRPYCSTVELF